MVNQFLGAPALSPEILLTNGISRIATHINVWVIDTVSCVLIVLCSEILRVIDSLQLTAYKKVATPANWTVICYSI